MRTLIFAVSVLFAFLAENSLASSGNELTAILSLKKGSEVSSKDLQKILKHPSVKQSREVFSSEEKKILKGIEADYLGKSWVLTLKDEKSFDVLEKQLRRLALPMNLDWNDYGWRLNRKPLSHFSGVLKTPQFLKSSI